MPENSFRTTFLVVLMALAVPSGVRASDPAPSVASARALSCPAGKRVVTIIVDGLRPDLVTPARMPTLAALAARGVSATAHHSIFPTVTRVNAASLVTGMLPTGHGLLGNTVYLPTVAAARTLSTASAIDMRMADSALGGRLLSAPTIHDVLQRRGRRSVVASAGSPGSAYVLGAGGRATVLNTELTLPASLHPTVIAVLGEAPAEARPNVARNARAVDALLRIGIDSLCADLAYLWLSDPDHTTHAEGLGSMRAHASLTAVDAEIARLLAGLDARGMHAATNVIVVSDHGFSTHAGDGAPIRDVLAAFAADVIVAENAVYLRAGHEDRLPAIVSALQRSPEIGPVFTRHGAGGTLRYDAIGWEHARSGSVLFGANWSHAANELGVKGSTRQAGTAGHGTSSPYDVRATFIAAGPAFRRGAQSSLPTSNADIAPTVLQLLGIPVPRAMSGRIAAELLRATPAGTRPRVHRDSSVAETIVGDVRYRVTLHRSRVGRTRYVDSTVTERTRP